MNAKQIEEKKTPSEKEVVEGILKEEKDYIRTSVLDINPKITTYFDKQGYDLRFSKKDDRYRGSRTPVEGYPEGRDMILVKIPKGEKK